jgi:ubiquitin-protein ligase
VAEAAVEEKTAEAVAEEAAEVVQAHLAKEIKTSNPNYGIKQELKEFLQDPPSNLSVKVGTNLRVWIHTMKGAQGSIYGGETFLLRIRFAP